jgi:hypothetical protein
LVCRVIGRGLPAGLKNAHGLEMQENGHVR